MKGYFSEDSFVHIETNGFREIEVSQKEVSIFFETKSRAASIEAAGEVLYYIREHATPGFETIANLIAVVRFDDDTYLEV